MTDPFKKPTLVLELDAREVIFLTDLVGNGDIAQGLDDRDAYVPVGREALLLLGSAYVEVVSQGPDARGVIPLAVTEEQVWLLRSKVKTDSLGADGQPIGYALLVKLYRLLGRFNSGMMDLDTVPEPEVDVDVAAALARWREADARSARSDPGPDEGPYAGAVPPAAGGAGAPDGPGADLSGSERQGDADDQSVPAVG